MHSRNEHIFWYRTKNCYLLKTATGVPKSIFFCNETGSVAYYLVHFVTLPWSTFNVLPRTRTKTPTDLFLGLKSSTHRFLSCSDASLHRKHPLEAPRALKRAHRRPSHASKQSVKLAALDAPHARQTSKKDSSTLRAMDKHGKHTTMRKNK